jgi:putative flippase GtrA
VRSISSRLGPDLPQISVLYFTNITNARSYLEKKPTSKDKMVMNDNQTVASKATSAQTAPPVGVFAKLLRFALAGAASTFLYFLLATLAVRQIGISPVAASCLAYLICIITSYLLQSRFTFRARNDSTKQIAKFVSVSVVGLAAATLVMQWAVNVQGLPYWIGAAFVSLVIPIINFITFSIWVFVDR